MNISFKLTSSYTPNLDDQWIEMIRVIKPYYKFYQSVSKQFTLDLQDCVTISGNVYLLMILSIRWPEIVLFFLPISFYL